MKKTLLVDQNISLTRICLIENNQCLKLLVSSTDNELLEHAVVQGQVSKIVKNLKGAFIDIGHPKNGLLHFKKVPADRYPSLAQGQRLPVQIKKQYTNEKGHQLTGFIQIPGCYLICMPFEKGIHISKKIQDPSIREALKSFLGQLSGGKCGFIVRTNAQLCTHELLEKEATYLIKQCEQILVQGAALSKGSILFKGIPSYIQALWEWITPQDELDVVSNDQDILESIQTAISHFLPQMNITYKSYLNAENIFYLYDVEKVYENLMRQKIWLKNGGNLVIQKTEAMTVIDVNSAKAIDKKNHDKVILKLNTLAIEEAIDQIILRNISGLIIIDLVAIQSEETRKFLSKHAQDYAARKDSSRIKVLPISELDLLQISRSRKHQSLEELLFEKCPVCSNEKGHSSILGLSFKLEQKIKSILKSNELNIVYIECESRLYDFLLQKQFKEQIKEKYQLNVEFLKKDSINGFLIKYNILV